MPADNPQKEWDDYFERKRAERLGEASKLWELMQDAGVTNETALALDFVCFGPSQSNVEDLAKQLSENYEIKVEPLAEQGYWCVKGTTRPYGIELEEEQHLGWVEFMSDVAKSYACAFSAWSLEAPSLGIKFKSEDIESDC